MAARRLAGWGFPVQLDIPDADLHPLPGKQLFRALAAGAVVSPVAKADIFVDAYFGYGPILQIADISIPRELYEHFGILQPAFQQSGIMQLFRIIMITGVAFSMVAIVYLISCGF